MHVRGMVSFWLGLVEKKSRQRGTYTSNMVTARHALACVQYCFKCGLTGGPQDFVMYHGAPGWGWSGSDMSGAV